VRSGTLDAAAIASFAVALDVAVRAQPGHARRSGSLRDRLSTSCGGRLPMRCFADRKSPVRDSRQRSFHLPGLRGRLAAVTCWTPWVSNARPGPHARRACRSRSSRAARDGRGRAGCARCAAVLARTHVDAGDIDALEAALPAVLETCARRGLAARRGHRLGWSDARARRAVRWCRLGRGGRPCDRRGPRRRRGAPGTIAQPRPVPDRVTRVLLDEDAG